MGKLEVTSLDAFAPTTQKDLISRLKILGLSTHAAKAYLSLLSHPKTSAVHVSKETGIPDSKIYYALDELTKKGLTVVQQSRPNIYKPIHPKEAINNLKQQVTAAYEQKLTIARKLVDTLSPIMDSSIEQEDIELAYVIRGKAHILRRMKEMIGSAVREVTVYISEIEIFDSLLSTLTNLQKRVKVRIALVENLLSQAIENNISQARHLPCDCSLVIVDQDVFLKISSWPREIAIISRDSGLITMLNEYYEAPCCSS
ncbi:MAG: helix-turn-helix domain-containing protein [Candidatus Thorarchaeota archaeon]